MRFGSTARILLKCKLKYYRISECDAAHLPHDSFIEWDDEAMCLNGCCDSPQHKGHAKHIVAMIAA